MAALRRDTARNLSRAFRSELAFVQAVADELAAKRIKPKLAEKLIIGWHRSQEQILYMLEMALRDANSL